MYLDSLDASGRTARMRWQPAVGSEALCPGSYNRSSAVGRGQQPPAGRFY
jgi:hypothetical protein